MPDVEKFFPKIVINGTKTHNPDHFLVHNLANDILRPAKLDADCDKLNLIECAVCRIFKAICDSLGVSDNSAGSEFQRLFAQFADELSTRKIDFKLFMSINPAHFLTLSNPKRDKRGSTMTSCHSFNVSDSEYNCGGTGYARDNVIASISRNTTTKAK